MHLQLSNLYDWHPEIINVNPSCYALGVCIPYLCCKGCDGLSSFSQIIGLLNVFTPQKTLEEFQDV